MSASPLKRARSGSSLSARSQISERTASDQKPREARSTPYRDARYETLLATKGSFLNESDTQLAPAQRQLCRDLLTTEQPTPSTSLFHEDRFLTMARKLQRRNEARVVRDLGLLITPSAETLATDGATELAHLIDGCNEGWNRITPLLPPRPQPDYSVGFRRSAFSPQQLTRLHLEFDARSYFTALDDMLFPFLTTEIKCGAQGLDIADRQNAHSMTVAVRALVELYRMVDRLKELHGLVLAFSISHDHRAVRIYGHYAEIATADDVKYYRYLIHAFDIMTLDGRDRLTAYKFTRNVYDHFVPTHLDRIKSALDQLPDPVAAEPVALEDGTDFDRDAASSSQLAPSQDVVFKMPGRPASMALTEAHEKEVAQLTTLLGQLREDMKQQREQHREEKAQLMTLLQQLVPKTSGTD
jgi:hypothetical protein